MGGDDDDDAAAAPRRAARAVSFDQPDASLQDARRRAQATGSATAAARAHPSGDESSDDETTGMVSRASTPGYQTLPTNRPADDHARGRPRDGDRVDGAAGAPSAWRRALGGFQSIELDNHGSVARDHLSLERTFLAWLRTSLAFASIGIAVTQLFRLNTSLADGDDGAHKATLRRMGKPLGAAFLGISILTLLLGFRRYFRAQEWVMRGKFPASRGTVMVLAAVALAIMLASLVVVIVIHPTVEGAREMGL